LTELQAPLSDGLVGEENATHRHYSFNVAKAQSDGEGEPHSMANVLGRKTMTATGRRGGVHQPIMPHMEIYSTPASLS
jgi:hypothetical protein